VLRLAADEPLRDVEHVHRLRVATRRAVAAVEMFERLCPRKKAARVARQLKRIRRAAGEARDLDVLIERWSAVADRNPLSPQARLLGSARRKRESAQEKIVALAKKLEKKGFCERVDKLLSKVRPRGKSKAASTASFRGAKGDGTRDEAHRAARPSIAAAAREALVPLAEELSMAAAADVSDDRCLHALRIRGKRLRYALELLAAVLPAALAEGVHEQLVEMQDHLGAVNDRAAALARLRAWLDEASDLPETTALGEAIATEHAALADERAKFFRWWTDAQREELLEQLQSGLSSDLR
jgi:CHAD domain-containing protein